jgi:hypothetical protein
MVNVFEQLTTEEQSALQRVLAKQSSRAKHAVSFTIERLLDKWSRFVTEVENGYELSVYDYTNDLAVRDLIMEVAASIPERLRLILLREVEPWDDRFRIATRRSSLPVAPGITRSSGTWWWRVPRLLCDELRKDLESEGLLDEKS